LQTGVKKALEMDRKNLLGRTVYISNCKRKKRHVLVATNSAGKCDETSPSKYGPNSKRNLFVFQKMTNAHL
jgi:hypothetical protein